MSAGEGRELDVAAILGGLDDVVPDGHRCGLVALVGRPNTGKSTLVNRLVGEKVTIVTKVPGTTRTTVRAVVTRDDAQVVLLDTPGLAKPRTPMASRMNQLVRDTWASVDVVALLVDAEAGVGGGDEYLVGELAGLRTPVVTVVNKTDALGAEALLPVLERVARLTADPPFSDVVPVSALEGDNVDRLVDVLVGHLPEAPRLFAAGRVSDQPDAQLAAELVREKVIADLRHELPHSVAVTVDGIEPDPGGREDLVHIDAVIHVERESQKGIIIGRGGERLKAAASAARVELEGLLGVRIHLTTRVKVAKDWQRDPRQLGRLGL